MFFSCAANKPAPQLDADGAAVTIVDESNSAENSSCVRTSLTEALARVHRWGPLRGPIALRILPDHQALEAAAGQKELPWLRAWTFPGELLLQAPASWPRDGPRDADALVGLLAHELTHALLYQALGGAEDPPLWFREGMASVTAHQQAHRLSPAQLRSWRLAHPGVDLFAATPLLLRDEHAAVYSAAHLAFARLLEQHGEAAILGVLEEERAGASFRDAFQRRLGTSERAFLDSLP